MAEAIVTVIMKVAKGKVFFFYFADENRFKYFR